jgi:hypothetical protein
MELLPIVFDDPVRSRGQIIVPKLFEEVHIEWIVAFVELLCLEHRCCPLG